MNIGIQTASLINHIQSRAVIGQPEPEVGMGATILAWTDRYAATVISYSPQVNGRHFVCVQLDRATRTDKNGMSECQEYAYEADEEGARHIYRKTASGQWQEVRLNETTGRWNKVDGYGLRIGRRNHYHDFSF